MDEQSRPEWLGEEPPDWLQQLAGDKPVEIDDVEPQWPAQHPDEEFTDYDESSGYRGTNGSVQGG